MSKIISYNWTTAPLLADWKHCTRRDWSHPYAARFKAGEVCQAWDHLPRTRKGRKVADIRIELVPYWELLRDMPDQDYEEEGFSFYEKYPHLLPESAGPLGMSFDYFKLWRYESGGMYVVRFALEDVMPGARELYGIEDYMIRRAA